MDQIDAAIAIHRRGFIAHENAALTMLLQMDPERETIRGAIRRAVYLADAQMGRQQSKVHDNFLAKLEPNEVRTRRGRYAIYATVIEAGTHGLPDLTLVVIEHPGSGSATLHELAARYHLTPREAEVLQLLREGASTRHIAAAMRITLNTTRRHIERLLAKLGVHSRVAAVAAIGAEDHLE
jgi:DNA-binding CsgD family transcriptional regulator